jgi:L-serine dehydratase
VIAGLLGFDSEDERIGCGAAVLEKLQAEGGGFTCNIKYQNEFVPHWHPNSLVMKLSGVSGSTLTFRGSSVGGGAISIDEIDGYVTALSGELPAIIVEHHDEVGVISLVSSLLAYDDINIASISCNRKEKGENALLIVVTDSVVPSLTLQNIKKIKGLRRVLLC